MGHKKFKMEYISEQEYKQLDYSEQRLQVGDYENCQFLNCNFINSDLSDTRFMGCEFVDCNLSNVKLNNTSFQQVKFRDCKMLGLQFDGCLDLILSFEFENCVMNHSSFYQKNIKKTRFINCQLNEVDFTECNLKEASFENSNLTRAIFDNTNLEKADLATATDLSIDPEKNKIWKAKFSNSNISGLLDKYNIDIEP